MVSAAVHDNGGYIYRKSAVTLNGGITTNKTNKRIAIILITVFLLTLAYASPAFALTESEVEAQVTASGKEAVAGNVLIWLLCAVAFLKVSQKVDSFLASLGVNVGHTGSSLMAEVLIATRALSAVTRVGRADSTSGRASGRASSGSTGASTIGSYFKGGLAGIVNRRATSNAIKTATSNTSFHNEATSAATHPSQQNSHLGAEAVSGMSNAPNGNNTPGVCSAAGASERETMARQTDGAVDLHVPNEPASIRTSAMAESMSSSSQAQASQSVSANQAEILGSGAPLESDHQISQMEESTVTTMQHADEQLPAAAIQTSGASDSETPRESSITENKLPGTAAIATNKTAVQKEPALEKSGASPFAANDSVPISSFSLNHQSDGPGQTAATMTAPGEPTPIVGAIPSAPYQEDEQQSVMQETGMPVVAGSETNPVLTGGETNIHQSQQSAAYSSGQSVTNAGQDVTNQTNVSGKAQASIHTAAQTNVRSAHESSNTNTVHRSAHSTSNHSILGDNAPKAYGIGGRMFMKSLASGGEFANEVIGRVARGDIQSTGTITGEMATQALNSYMGVASPAQNAPSLPVYSHVEIGGGRISGYEHAADNHQDVQFCMYDASQYSAPQGEHTTVITADGATWYKQYEEDAVDRKPYMAPDGAVAYNETIVKRMPKPPQRKSRM